MISVSVGHITMTQPVENGGPWRGSNPQPPGQMSHSLPTELLGFPERERERERERDR